MSDFPVIRTAIPKRRYQLGSYSVSLLGEIDSGDDRDYRFIMAFVGPGKSRPDLYVCSERNRDPSAGGSHLLWVVSAAMSEALGADDRWKDLEAFSEQALDLGRQMLGLERAEAVRIG
jgi:hypothetical protein